MYNVKCDELARYFLEDEKHDEDDVEELAQQIQDVVDDWMSAFLAEAENEKGPEE